MYTYVLNSVVKISMMFAKYFEYYTIILREAVFSWTRCITICNLGEGINYKDASPNDWSQVKWDACLFTPFWQQHCKMAN